MVYTAQVHNLVSRVLCQGFETKHGTPECKSNVLCHITLLSPRLRVAFSQSSRLLSRRGIVLCASRGLFVASFGSLSCLRLSLALEWAGFVVVDFLILVTCCFDQVFLYFPPEGIPTLA
jgi:hypothetical protein